MRLRAVHLRGLAADVRETYGINPKEEDFYPFVGAGEDRFIGGVAEKYGIRLDPARDKARTYAIYLEIIRGHLKPLPGVGEFVRRCRERGLKIAVASAADAVKVNGNLRQIGLDRGDIRRRRHRQRRAAEKAGPGNLPRRRRAAGAAGGELPGHRRRPNGLRAGKTAGAVCLGLTTKFDAATLRAAGADWTAPDLAHAPDEVFGDETAARGTVENGVFAAKRRKKQRQS